MAAQPPLGPRKRSGPEPCAAGWAGPGPGPGPAPPAAAGRSGGALENGFPPHKRPRSSGAAGPEEGPSDPFGDNDDFTADDLEEIDILASQALSQEAAAAAAPPRHAWAAFGASGAERRAAAGQPRGVAPAAGRRPKGSGRRRAVGPRRLLPSAGGGSLQPAQVSVVTPAGNCVGLSVPAPGTWRWDGERSEGWSRPGAPS